MLPRFALVGLPVVVLTGAAVATSGGSPGRWPLHVALFVAAGASWAGALAMIRRIPARRGDGLVLFAVALAVRLGAWAAPVAHSDDIYRYAWDGRVARAGINPFLHPPAAPELASLRGGAPPPDGAASGERAPPRAPRGGTLFERINNPDLPTLYPPAAQIAFRVAASLPLPPLGALRMLFAGCDLALLGLLHRWLRRRGDDPRWAAAWGWSPLVAIEVGQNGHLDALPLLFVVASLSSFEAGRRGRAGLWLGVATAAKGFALPLLLGMRSARAALAAALAVAVLALPYVGAGRSLGGSTGELARRWRGNDGAFALIHAAAGGAVCLALDAPPSAPGPGGRAPCAGALDLWRHPAIAQALTGRGHRTAVYADELAGALARGAVALLLAGLAAWLVLRRKSPIASAEWVFGALLLFTPALKPWYVLWLLPIAAVTRRGAWIALAALVPLGYLPMAAWLGGAPWTDPAWTRLVEHGVCWALLAAAALTPAAGGTNLDPQAAPVTIRFQ